MLRRELLCSENAVRTLLSQAAFPCGTLSQEDTIAVINALGPFVQIGSAFDGDRLVEAILAEAFSPKRTEPVIEVVRRIFNRNATDAFEKIEELVQKMVHLPDRLREPMAVCAAVTVRPTEALSLSRERRSALWPSAMRPEA